MPLLGGLAEPFGSLLHVLPHAFVFTYHGKLILGPGMPLPGGLAEPVLRFASALLRDIVALDQCGDPPLRIDIALCGGLSKPARRRVHILRHALAFEAGICPGELLRFGQCIPGHIFFKSFQGRLRFVIALSGGLAQPVRRFGLVLRASFHPPGIQLAQSDPGVGMPLLGGLAQPVTRRGHIPFYEQAALGEYLPHLELSNDIARMGRFEEMGQG